VTAAWDTVLDTCIAAFTPIHEGFEQALGHELFQLVYPDWKASNEAYLRFLCESDDCERMLVAELQGRVAGFIHYEVVPKKSAGMLGSMQCTLAGRVMESPRPCTNECFRFSETDDQDLSSRHRRRCRSYPGTSRV